jgi:hypothetical protein
LIDARLSGVGLGEEGDFDGPCEAREEVLQLGPRLGVDYGGHWGNQADHKIRYVSILTN